MIETIYKFEPKRLKIDLDTAVCVKVGLKSVQSVHLSISTKRVLNNIDRTKVFIAIFIRGFTLSLCITPSWVSGLGD